MRASAHLERRAAFAEAILKICRGKLGACFGGAETAQRQADGSLVLSPYGAELLAEVLEDEALYAVHDFETRTRGNNGETSE